MKFLLDFSDNEMSEQEKEKLILSIKEGKKFYPIEGTFFAEYDEAGFSLGTEEGVHMATLSCSYTDFLCDMQEEGFNAKEYTQEEMDKMTDKEKKEMERDAQESCKEKPFKDKISEFENKPTQEDIVGCSSPELGQI